MTPEDEAREHRYVLLLNGANFACEVLEALLRLDSPPDLLVVPEYPPAARPEAKPVEFGSNPPQSRLAQLAGSIPHAYAPERRQQQCARLIRQRSIDFMLVACWPYLIAPAMIASVTKAALNLHPSMLPAYRGADPVGRQIERGERRLGVSLHLLSQRFDEGDIVARASLPPLGDKPDRETVEREAARLGAGLFIDTLKGYDARWQPQPQSALSAAPD
jgi:methionyl-tRNA formyltransferase